MLHSPGRVYKVLIVHMITSSDPWSFDMNEAGVALFPLLARELPRKAAGARLAHVVLLFAARPKPLLLGEGAWRDPRRPQRRPVHGAIVEV